MDEVREKEFESFYLILDICIIDVAVLRLQKLEN
jgi:hypothetical protein